MLEFIHNKFFNLIQNAPHKFLIGTEELKTIKALQLLWSLIHTKNINRVLAKKNNHIRCYTKYLPSWILSRWLSKYEINKLKTNKVEIKLSILYKMFFFFNLYIMIQFNQRSLLNTRNHKLTSWLRDGNPPYPNRNKPAWRTRYFILLKTIDNSKKEEKKTDHQKSR